MTARERPVELLRVRFDTSDERLPEPEDEVVEPARFTREEE